MEVYRRAIRGGLRKLVEMTLSASYLPNRLFRAITLGVGVVAAWSFQVSAAHAQASGSIDIRFLEKETAAPLASRVRISAADGKTQRIRGSLHVQGWNLIEGDLSFKGRVGDYRYQASHGPQFSAAAGGFTLDRKSQALDVVHLPRHCDLALEGWHAGDLMARVDSEDALRWLPAEDLIMAVVVSEQSLAGQPELQNAERWIDRTSYLDTRPGSGLTLHHWLPPATVPAGLPSSRLLVMAKESRPQSESLPVHAEIQKLWARDVPIWLASGRIDSIQLLGDHLSIDGERTAKFTPIVDPDPGRFRGPRGAGRMVEAIYWQVLECGLPIPPSAGSGFGKTTSPLGYNRVYAHAPNPTPSAWWQAIRDGQSFVTNGPLLRVTVNQELPGHTFTAAAGQGIELDIALKLTVSDPVEYLEVINNGATLYRARLDEYARQGGKIPPQIIRESGWLLVRVVTEHEPTYRIATTAPYYVLIGDEPRISRSAVAFFQRWLEQTTQQLEQLDFDSRSSATPYLSAAKEFWLKRAEAANAE